MSQLWHQINVPLLYAIPVFVVLVAIEAAVLRHVHHDEDQRRGYLGKDTRASITMGLGSLVSSGLFKAASLVVFVALWAVLAPWHIPVHTWWSWALLMVLVDFGWYCYHRFTHRVRIGWAGHQAHHSSEYFNLGTAVRQKWTPWFEFVFWLPLPLLGFAPWTIYIAFMFNLIFQFFVHTELVSKLAAPIEFIFNTPSHHRVHHGSDPEYLDKNYGGILIVWDRMFGTFQRELHRPTYGLTTQVDTYDVVKLQFHEFGNIIADVRAANGLRNKLRYVFGPPGWKPAAERAQEIATA
jgi:sterol desaturase/sphingolipid hydroxylase (fatty acid hydroxylase superfamily)